MRLAALWRRLIEPGEAVQEPEHRRRARLLAGMLLTIILVGVWIFVTTIIIELADSNIVTAFQEKPLFPVVSVSLVVFIIAYRLSRGKYYTWGAVFLIANLFVTDYLVLINAIKPHAVVSFLNYLTVCTLLGSMFLPLWGTVTMYIVTLLAVQVLPRFAVNSVEDYSLAIGASFNNVLLTGLLIIVAAVIRQQDLEQIQQQARELIETTLDVARRKQAAKTLAKERNLLRTLIDNIPDHIFVKDAGSRFIVNNVAHMHSLGTSSQEELAGKMDADFVAPELAERYYADEQGIVRSGQALIGREEFIVDPKDREQWFLTTKVPLRDIEGDVVGLVGISRDITERKWAEEALRESEERYRSLVETTSDWIWEVDRDATFTYSNPKVRDILGYDPEELVGKSMYDLMVPDEEKRIHSIFRDARDSRPNPFRLENVNQHKDGRLVVLEESGVPILDVYGNHLGYRGISRDTTVRKRAEETLQRAKQAAEKAQRAAEEANQAKSQFLATMSHELRTPLNGILGYAQILKRDLSTNQNQLDGLNIIEQSGHDLLVLINDILDLAKVESGRVDLHKMGFDLRAFLQGISEMIRIRAEYKGLYFRTKFVLGDDEKEGEELPIGVHGDERRLRQVLFNLLDNGIKFTDEGDVTFEVERLDSADTGSLLLRFTIKDTGIGMSPEELSIVFEPFQQAGDQRRQTRGTGLGLTISRNLIELMGSELHVESRLGEGTTFYFDLVLSEAVDWMEVLPTEERRIVGVKGETPKVLVVDDNWQNRVVIVDLLAPLGFEVWEAQDGQAGLTRASEFRPDVIITDLVMPGMGGIEFIQHIRQSPLLQDVVIFAISASAYDKDRQESLTAGSDAFIRKPVEADALLAQLRRHLDIEWVYADEDQQDSIQPGEDVDGVMPMMPPPPDELAALFELVVMGDVRALQERTDELDQVDGRLKPFATELRRLAKGFQIEKIRELLELYQK